MPTDFTAVITKSRPTESRHRAVILEPNEQIVFRKERGGYALLLTWALCKHHHRTPEKAFLCSEAHAQVQELLSKTENTP